MPGWIDVHDDNSFILVSACNRWRRMVCRTECRLPRGRRNLPRKCASWSAGICDVNDFNETGRKTCSQRLGTVIPHVRAALDSKFPSRRKATDVLDPVMASILHGLAQTGHQPAASDAFRANRGAPMDSLVHGLEHALSARLPGLWLEFGAFSGYTTRLIAGAAHSLGRKVHSFDSWKGLPEAWRGRFGKGAFQVRSAQPPFNDPRIEWVSGLFADTLPPFLKTHQQENISFVHIDCDLYSSTATVLRAIENRLSPGAVLVFDELINYDGYTKGELLALVESLHRTGRRVLPLSTPAEAIKPDGKALARVNRVYPDRFLQYIYPKNAALLVV